MKTNDPELENKQLNIHTICRNCAAEHLTKAVLILDELCHVVLLDAAH